MEKREPIMLYNQNVWFIMTDTAGRLIKMTGNVMSYDIKTETYRIKLPDNTIVHVAGSLLHPYGDAVAFMNNSSTAPGSPVTMPRTASSSSFNFTLNNGENADNNDGNLFFVPEENGDPWTRMAAFLNARNGSARNRTTKKNTSSKNESGKGIPIPKGKKARNVRRYGGRRRRTVRRSKPLPAC